MSETAKKVPTKAFQYQRQTPPDPIDGHTHTAAFDENGNGGTSEDGMPSHAHEVWEFRVLPYRTWDDMQSEPYMSVHPGTLAFEEKAKPVAMAKLGSIPEMEIFREGTHNGDEYTADDLDEMVKNFYALKDELRPKLKMTHVGEEEEQTSLAGLASYGDMMDVWAKNDSDGKRRLYARFESVPDEVIQWIKDRRFPERSIEIYPTFKLGTKDSPVYKNVLKAVALLGAQMPAVTGMAPIKLSAGIESQKTVCIGEICFMCEADAVAHVKVFADSLNFKMKLEGGKNAE